MKARQQRELSESVIAKIEKELENPKVLDQILKQSVQDVESKCSLREMRLNGADLDVQELYRRSHSDCHVTSPEVRKAEELTLCI